MHESCARPAAITSSAGRSRTGRYHVPAWQKRQPRVQPRITSTEARAKIAQAYGTTTSIGWVSIPNSAWIARSTSRRPRAGR